MNQANHTAASRTTPPTIRPATPTRRARAYSAFASVLVTCVLFAGVVTGMTSTDDTAGQVVARAGAGATA